MTKLNVNNIQINYRLKESKNDSDKTIVFIHGLSDSLNYWNILVENLDYQTLSFDLRGHGESTDDDKTTTIDLYTEDLFLLLEELNIENAVFAGLSLGGNVAMNLAIRHPKMVNGLIIMSSFSEFSDNLKEIFDSFYESINDGFESFYDTILPYTLPDDVLERNRETLEIIKKEAAPLANIDGIKAGIKAGYSFKITDKLNAIDVPTLIISGADDNLTDLELQSKIHDEIPDSEMIILENTKHNVLIGSNIEKVLELIGEFMLKIE